MEINVKKYVIKKLIEAYAAKYPFLDENDYRSLAIKNYTEHEIGHVLGSEDPNAQISKADWYKQNDKQNATQLANLYNTYGNGLPLYNSNGTPNQEVINFMLNDPKFRQAYKLSQKFNNNPLPLNQLVLSLKRDAARPVSNSDFFKRAGTSKGIQRAMYNSTPQG